MEPESGSQRGGGRSSLAFAETDPAGDLMALLGQVRRSVRRRVRRDWPHRPLTESERELIQVVHRTQGLRVQEAAVALGVAGNTVSTLVGRLTERGLLERRTDHADGRAARLHLTPVAVRRIGDWRDRRREIVEAAMRGLDPGDAEAIEAALPALRRLLDELERT